MSALRPLPPRPSLEFEHKEAKALLRRLRAGDPDALARARARHPAVDAFAPTRIRLADAQLVIAREYGFTSWPRLVRYFGDVARQRYCYHGSILTRDFYEDNVRGLLKGHRDHVASAWRTLAAYVPRCYGMPADEVFATPLTEDEARLAVARRNGFSSWEMLLEGVDEQVRLRESDQWRVDHRVHFARAIAARDLDELKRIADMHPEVLHPSEYIESKGGSPLRTALHHERRLGAAALRPIIEWLETQGLDLQRELNRQLCGHMHIKPDKVRWLLDRGADPNWIAPNGIPVLEHALIRYWNGDAVDVLAERAAPRDALWIASGLGDVNGVRRFLDRDGKPTVAARRLRPDFVAVGPIVIPALPDAGDEEILMEAFLVAVLNGRTAVIEYLASRGFDVNCLVYGSTTINMAVGNAMLPIVECLLRCGANLDLRGQHDSQTARDTARERYEQFSDNLDRRRIVELCGMDPDVILAERDARPVTPPAVDPKLEEALRLAGDDAFRLGQSDIRPENLLFGLLRIGGLPLMFFTKASRMDLDRFRDDVQDRVRPVEDRFEHLKLPLAPDSQVMMQTAIAAATERRRDMVQGIHLLYALMQASDGPAAALLARYGSRSNMLETELERAL